MDIGSGRESNLTGRVFINGHLRFNCFTSVGPQDINTDRSAVAAKLRSRAAKIHLKKCGEKDPCRRTSGFSQSASWQGLPENPHARQLKPGTWADAV